MYIHIITYYCVLCEKIARSHLSLRHKIEFSNARHIGVDVSSESWKLRMLGVVFFLHKSLEWLLHFIIYIYISPHHPQHAFIIIIITITFFSLIFPLQVISICFINLFQRMKKVFPIFPPSSYCCRRKSLLATKPI